MDADIHGSRAYPDGYNLADLGLSQQEISGQLWLIVLSGEAAAQEARYEQRAHR